MRVCRPVRRGDALTNRERQIVTLILDACLNKEIALSLRISESTVKNYLGNIFAKAGVNTRLELALWAVRSGFPRHPLQG